MSELDYGKIAEILGGKVTEFPSPKHGPAVMLTRKGLTQDELEGALIEAFEAGFKRALDSAISHLLSKPKVFRSAFERDAVVTDLRGMKVVK